MGCSNETCWGVMKSLWTAERHSVARYDTVQNNFSLINRRCESELAQVCRREGVSLLPYSPLGGGVLTGKYNDGNPPRRPIYRVPRRRRRTPAADGHAVRQPRPSRRCVAWQPIAQELGVTLPTLAVAWSKQHDFVASTIIGATSVEQLSESLAGGRSHPRRGDARAIDQIDLDIPTPMTEDGLRRL